ncbi:MAG TPA: HAMP domain-containing sensor histidine kinase, partial [Acidimicrobiia bacterium]
SRIVAEQIVSFVRLGIVTSMFIFVALGGTRLRPYPDQLWWVFAGSFAYVVFAIIKTTGDARRGASGGWTGWAMSALSAAFVVAFVACTGAGRSPLVPVAFTVVISTAIRFNLVRSVAVAAGMGAAMAAVILLVPQPDLPWSERVQNAAWYGWLLVAVAIFVGIFSQAADLARAARARAEAEAEAEHRRLDEEQRLRRRLEAVDQARKDFLLAVAHDFRMPIGSLESLSTALVRQRQQLGPDQTEMLERIERHARTLADMLEEVREVAITESLDAPRRIEIADVFMPDLASSAAASANLPAERLVVAIDPTLLVLRTDGGKLERVIANLLENAAGAEGSESPVELRMAPVQGAIELSVTAAGGQAHSQPPEKGSGLGMWVVAQVVAALGGSLHLEAGPGGGQVTRARFPELSAVSLPPGSAYSPQ